jgi:hypothetical protein
VKVVDGDEPAAAQPDQEAPALVLWGVLVRQEAGHLSQSEAGWSVERPVEVYGACGRDAHAHLWQRLPSRIGLPENVDGRLVEPHALILRPEHALEGLDLGSVDLPGGSEVHACIERSGWVEDVHLCKLRLAGPAVAIDAGFGGAQVVVHNAVDLELWGGKRRGRASG